MTIKVSFKNPDAINDAILDEIDTSKLEGDHEIDEIIDDANIKLEKWVRYGEVVTIEFDLHNMTAKVLEEK